MRTAEINTSAEMQTLVAEARSQEMNTEQEAAAMESEAREIEEVLAQAEAAARRQETAEQNATETKERINEASG